MALASRPLAAEQKAFYEDQGYLVVPELLSAAELPELHTALAEVLREAEGLTAGNDKFWVVPTEDGSRFSVQCIYDPSAYHSAFYNLVFNPKILDVVENLIGPNIQFHHTLLNLKPRSRYSFWVWHQDYPFFPHTNFDLLAVMIYLDAATPENGCLTVIPGSHKAGPLAHRYASAEGAAYGLEDESVLDDRTRWLDLPVPAGGMGVHHCNLLHSSRANLTDYPRSALTIWYRAADNVQVGGLVDHPGCGTQVRGVDPRTVRMVEGTFGLPRVGESNGD